MFIAGGGEAIGISGERTMEYSIWNNTDIWKSVHLVGADSVLRLKGTYYTTRCD